VKSEVLQIIVKIADNSDVEIDEETTLVSLNWDSLSNLAFISEIDSALSKSISIDSLLNAETVGDLVRVATS
jgi:acyl carrier protein